jgi:co-chaperonin GroES (HSP10)
MAVAMKMVHDADPAAEILERIGDLSAVDVFANQILLGVYRRPDKTASGIHLPDRTRDEDEHQGKVGLVLKVGPQAYVTREDERPFSDAEKVQPGQWVVMWVVDGRKILIRGQLCRVVEDYQIRMRVSEPDLVF